MRPLSPIGTTALPAPSETMSSLRFENTRALQWWRGRERVGGRGSWVDMALAPVAVWPICATVLFSTNGLPEGSIRKSVVSTAAYARLPLNALRVFEAVAARLSFADAAESLHVTPAAVSQQIKSLEDYLQVKLFKRSGRRVELTAEGQQLLPGVRRGLDELEAAMQHLKQNRSGGPLQISLLSSFLQRWLLPRIGAFNDLDTGIELRFHTSRDPVDFSRTEFNAAIRMGGGNYPGLYSEK